tara:strand:+ start:707 stop:979 length:273 start_codon:yes stop_codon:yes gene_type:complete
MGVFQSVRTLIFAALFIAIFFMIFGQAIPLIGNTALQITGQDATVGGKTVSSLVGNVFKLLIWIPLVALGMALYQAFAELIDRERSSGRN